MTVDAVKPHANADRLEIAVVGGWQCVVGKGEWQPGDFGVYFPPDTVLPAVWTDRFGVTQYCQPIQVNGEPRYRIRCAKLRGEPSFGVLVRAGEVFDQDGERPAFDGEEVTGFFGATKYEPPVRASAGDAENEHPLFPRYTEVENLRNYPTMFLPGEFVSITEKLHGTNCRVGSVEGELMAGSRKLRRAQPPAYQWATNTYWYPLTLEPVLHLLAHLEQGHKQVVLYGEVFGKGVQSLTYGQSGIAFRAFDLLVDGAFVNQVEFEAATIRFGVPRVPHIAIGQYGGIDSVAQYASGPAFAGGHIREGVVVKPVVERRDPKVGRVIAKYVSDAYLLGKHAEADTTDQ